MPCHLRVQSMVMKLPSTTVLDSLARSGHALCSCGTIGYMRPVRDWNIGKQQEHADRKFYTEAEALRGFEDAVSTV